MVSISKTISVVDESGRTLESTYLRRAKGLVKSGRAHWIHDCGICLKSDESKIVSAEATDMNIQVFEYIKEQIEYLKQEVSKEVSLNKDSQYQPEAAAKIYELKYLERQQIMKLLDRLFDVEVVKE